MQQSGLLKLINWGSVAAFFTIFGAMLLTVSLFGEPVPFFDEWDAEALLLYKPYIEGNLNLDGLITSHNGHRVIVTRITALILFMLNGGWDPELQMIVNALLHALTGTFLIGLMQKQHHCQFDRLDIVFALVLFTIPFSSLSLLVAFQTQFYYMLLFAVGSLWALTSGKHFIGYLLATLSFLSMTPGAFVFPAYMAVLLIEIIRNRSVSQNLLCHLFICGLLFLLIILTRSTETSDETFRAQHFPGFAISFLAALSWPFRIGLGVGVIVYVPLFLFLVRAPFISHLPRYYFALGIFLLLQIFAMAYFRGGEGVPPAERYWEILRIGVWVNGVCLLILLQDVRLRLMKPLALLWFIAIIFGLSTLARYSLTVALPERQAQSLQAQSLIVEFLDSSDSQIFQGISGLNMSYPRADILVQRLSDPTIRRVLPVSLNPENFDRLRHVKHWLLGLSSLLAIAGLGLFLNQTFSLLRLFNKSSNIRK